MRNKVFISGGEFLEEQTFKILRAGLLERKMEVVEELDSADAVILVTGDRRTLSERAEEIKKSGKRFFLMNSDPDEQGRFTLCMISGQASSPEQAAKWAWSILHEPHKWKENKK